MDQSIRNEKRLGSVLIIIGILVVLLSVLIKVFFAPAQSMSFYAVLWFVSGLLVAFGFMLRRADEAEKRVAETQLKISKEFKEAKAKERQKEDFKKFLDGFSKDEIEVIEIVHTYEGILDSELEKRVRLGNDKLLKVLEKLKKEDVLNLMPHGRSKKIFLKKMS